MSKETGSDLHRSYSILFYAINLFVLALGASMIWYWPESWEPHREGGVALGHGLFIAGFLGLIVDQYVKAHFIREVTKDVFHHLIGYDLPAQVKDRLRDLMRITVIRSRCCLDCRFERQGEDHLKVEVALEYDLANYSNHRERYTPELALESHENPTFVSLTVSGPNGFAYSMSKEELTRTLSEPEEGAKQVNGRPFKIPPRNLDEPYHVKFRYNIVVPSNYTDVLHLVHPTMDVSITAELPEGFEFRVSGGQRIAKSNRFEVKYPQDCIRIRCFPSAKS